MLQIKHLIIWNMKSYIYALVALAGLSMFSCDSRSQLGKDVAGDWQGTMERMENVQEAETQFMENISFMPDEGNLTGTFILTGMGDVTNVPTFNNEVIETVSRAIAFTSSVQGTYKVIDDDELSLMFDFKSLNVSVDTSDVASDANILMGVTTPSLDRVKPQLYNTIKSQLTAALKDRYSGMNLLDDVKVKDRVMKLEVGKKDLVFHRQGQAK